MQGDNDGNDDNEYEFNDRNRNHSGHFDKQTSQHDEYYTVIKAQTSSNMIIWTSCNCQWKLVFVGLFCWQ